ncbi:MAG: sulfotransferase domain-containing protein [Patescibacteria group bacterium]|jgi:hypothetical protein
MNQIIIVSGLPRSGTSMMMKMLEAGGVPVLADHVRTADEDNPKGYYEFERVKQLKTDQSWLLEAGGKVVKMVSMLLYDLPAQYQYKIIFMRRKISEIIASQKKMLARSGKQTTPEEDREVAELFEQHLVNMQSWLTKQTNISVMYFWYHEILSNPKDNIVKINQFFDNKLDTVAMSQVVDKALYRNKIN